MKWNEKLYLGEEAGKKKAKIIKQLEHHQVAFGVYVITTASNGKDLLDILPAVMLYKKNSEEIRILGLAVTKQEAFEVCERIILDVYAQTGGYDVRSFFT